MQDFPSFDKCLKITPKFQKTIETNVNGKSGPFQNMKTTVSKVVKFRKMTRYIYYCSDDAISTI